MAKVKFEKLFTPCNIGGVKLKNRLVKTASQTYLFEPDEVRVGPLVKAFYGALAKGGTGLVIVETPVMEWPIMKTGDCRMRLDSDDVIPNVKELVDAIHEHDCPAFIQFYHRGPWAAGAYNMGATAIAASAVTLQSEFDVHTEKPPHALTIDEIHELTERYAAYALRVRQAGFDGLEVHAGADHLFHTFLSRYWNRRDDMYGGNDLRNRIRFLVEVIRAIKTKVGEDYPIQVLMNGYEFGVGDQGITVEEAVATAKILEENGVNSLQVRSHWDGMHWGSSHADNMFYPEPHIPIEQFPKELEWSYKGPLVNVPVAAAVKEAVKIPIMTVGGLAADTGEMILQQGKVDLIGMTRRFLADHNYANKAKEGRVEDIQPCTHCAYCYSIYNAPRHCRINPCFGRESYEPAAPGKKKKVVVIGGGPAGMQAARTAAMRGNDVTLFEKSGYLGGALPIAALVKGFDVEDITLVIDFYKTQLKKQNVKIKLGTEFTPADLDAIKPDVAVVAVGGEPVYPDVPGIDGKNVTKSGDLYGTLKFFLKTFGPKKLRTLTKMWMPVGKEVVILGGAIQGCQLGEYLTKRGRKVTIVDMGTGLGDGLYSERKLRLFYWFRKKDVTLIDNVKVVEITKEGVVIENKEGGGRRLLKADAILPAMPFKENHGLYEQLKGKVPEVYSIGDGDKPGLIPDTTWSGWEVGNKI
ncbi:MAG: NADH:flavin oxidoreductase / oxidase family [Acidobacteria bacterium]|nr:NADH:flavin oxidoreductase / oxidase family [Acidobacteriota bacterium]